MVERFRSKKPRSGGDYFPDRGAPVCIPSGCTLLDCVLGSGWALGRVVNIVGDTSSGKTLLAIEACANFARRFPKGKIWYREAESAFDVGYAEGVGLPVDTVDFGKDGIKTHWDTIEDIFEDLDTQLEDMPKDAPGLYIIDSLDALTSRADLERKVGQGSYHLEKQKILAELFKTLIRRVNSSNVCVIFISQTRQKIGAMFGDKYTRTGGDSLNFYASQILWLHHMGRLVRTVKGTKRVTGIKIKARSKKSKVGTSPFRECEFVIRFGYGVQDVEASLAWLKQTKQLSLVGVKDSKYEEYLADLDDLDDVKYVEQCELIRKATIDAWEAIEVSLRPKRRKYAA